MHASNRYLDYSATTPVDARVAEKMIPWLTQNFGNPASRKPLLRLGSERRWRRARRGAKLVNCEPKEIGWTSGGDRFRQPGAEGRAHFYKAKASTW